MVPGAAIRHMSCRRVGLTAIGARRYPQELYLRFAAWSTVTSSYISTIWDGPTGIGPLRVNTHLSVLGISKSQKKIPGFPKF